MSGILSALFINSRISRVTLLLLILLVFDLMVLAKMDGSQNNAKTYDELSNGVSDSVEKIRTIFNGMDAIPRTTKTATTTTTTQIQSTFNELVKPINERVKQKTVSSSSPNDDNDYRSMKRAFDTFNGKMDMYMEFYGNEMSFLTTKLNTLKDKLNILEILHHEIDQIVSRQNMAEQKLQAIQEAMFGSQSINSKLDRLELLMLQTLFRLDDLTEKQRKLTLSSDELKRKNENNDQLSNNDEQCESKIEQLVTFVHSFAELNRLESTDILNRLGNMQSQLIQFFDVKGTEKIATNKLSEKSVNNSETYDIEISESRMPYFNQSSEDDSINVTATEINSTYLSINESTTIPSTIFNATDNTKIPIPITAALSYQRRRKRKRHTNTTNRYKRIQKLNVTELNTHTFNVSHFHNKNRLKHNVTDFNQTENVIDVNTTVIKNDKQINAKYGQPSQYGCHQFSNHNNTEKIYRFTSINGTISERLCSFDKNGNAWTVIQQRMYMLNPENFNRSWNDYKNGFGNLSGEFWYGNDFIHKLTYDDDMELKIQLESWDDQHIELHYNIFRVDSEANHYNLFVSDFYGNNKQLDAFSYHHNQDFSTYDRQHDKTGINDDKQCCSCAKSYASGWWFNNCIESNLNGIYQSNPLNNNYVGIIWEKWLGDYSLKATKMMIRPKVQWMVRNENEHENDETDQKPPDDP